MNSEMNTRLEELCNDEQYVKYVLSLGSAEAMSKELENKEIDISPEEIRQIGTLLRKKANGELSDEELEAVSGGFSFFAFVMCFASAVTASVFGIGIYKTATQGC